MSLASLEYEEVEQFTREFEALFNAGDAGSFTLPAGSWRDVVSGQTATSSITMPAQGWRYLRRD